MSKAQAIQIRDFVIKIANTVVSSVFKLFILAVPEKIPGGILLKQICTKFEDMDSECDSLLCDEIFPIFVLFLW